MWGMIQDAIIPLLPQAASFSRGAVGRKQKCTKLWSNTELSTGSSDPDREEEAREADQDKWPSLRPCLHSCTKPKVSYFSGKKNWELYNIFHPRKATIPGKGFHLCTEGWLWAGWEWRGWAEEKPVTDGWYLFEILHMRLFPGKVRGFTEALLDTKGDWNGTSGERLELSPVLREIKTQ